MSGSDSSTRTAAQADAADSAVLLLDATGRVRAASPGAGRLVGRQAELLRGHGLGELFRHVPDGAFAWIAALAEAHEPPAPLRLSLELVRGDGLLVGFEAVMYAIRVGAAEAPECVAGLTLRPGLGLVLKSELLMAQREVLDLVARGSGLRDSLGAVAAFAERCMPGEIFCLISPVDAAGLLETAVATTLPDDVAHLQAGRRCGERWSPATVAASGTEPCLAPDLADRPEWSEFAARLQRHGLTSSWAVPIRGSRVEAVGAVLEFLLPVRRAPSASESGLIEELAGMVRLALDLHALAVELRERSTAQHEAESESRRRGERLDALVQAALDAVISIDRQGRIEVWNAPAEAMFGWSAAETNGRPLSEFIIPPEMRKAHQEGLRRVVETGHGPLLGRRIEITAIDRAGRRFPVELAINRIPGTGGFSAFLRDISDRRRADAAVKSSEERLKLVIEASADGIWDLRLDGGGSMVSDRCATMLGRDPMRQVPVRPPEHPWLHPADRAAVQRAWLQHMEGQTPRYESEHRRQAADGSWRWVAERGKVVERDAAGRVQRVVGIVRDITERRTLEASLSSAERLESLGLVSGGLVRQFDELLGVIRAHASLANVEAKLPARVRESLEVIQMTVARGKALARSVMGLSPQSGEAQAALVCPGDVLREGLPLLQAGVPRTVSLRLEDRTEGRGLVRLDPAALQQCAVNMVLRACEAVANAGSILLRVEPADAATLAISCIDSGSALAPDTAARVGEAVDESGALLGRAALGMAAVRRFAESCGGTLQAARTDEGNVVTLRIPAQPGEVPVERPVIALCEDHPLLAPMLADVLHAAGHRVLRAERGERLLPLLRSERPGSVAVVDEAGWRSISAVWHANCHEAGVRPGVVVLGDRVGGPMGPGFEWIAKPFTAEALLDAVARVASWSASLSRPA